MPTSVRVFDRNSHAIRQLIAYRVWCRFQAETSTARYPLR